jgi:hypothetical protein
MLTSQHPLVRPRRQETDEEDDEEWEGFFDEDEGYGQDGLLPGDDVSTDEPVDEDLIDEPLK